MISDSPVTTPPPLPASSWSQMEAGNAAAMRPVVTMAIPTAVTHGGYDSLRSTGRRLFSPPMPRFYAYGLPDWRVRTRSRASNQSA